MNLAKIFATCGTSLMIACAALGVTGRWSARADTPGSGSTWTQQTASYSVELDIVPAMQMLTPDQAQTATAGMVMVDMSGMSMPAAGATPMAGGSSMAGMTMAPGTGTSGNMSMGSGAMAMTMATTDNGQPVNHHLGVHVHTLAGALVSTIMPAITIVNDGTGTSETLSDVMPMYDMPLGQSDLHFGNNVYLPDGTYTVTVGVGSETASFPDIQVMGGAGLSASSPSSTGP